jgi:AraC-like DNA-binding protein
VPIRRRLLDTADVAPRERLATWLDVLARVCGVLHADPLDAHTLDGTMELGEVGRLRLGRIVASRHRIGLTPALARTDTHDVAKVIVQTVGTSIYEQHGERVVLGPGDGLVYDVARPHLITSPEHTEHLVVIVPRDVLAERGLELRTLRGHTFSARSGVGRLGADLVASTLRELDAIAPAWEAELATSILNLLLPLASATDAGRTALRLRIEGYIREHLRDPQLSLEQIARSLRCSKRTLHLAFADADQTIAELIRASRLDACRAEILRNPERAVSEIAFGWGFASAAHFTRVFRDRFGEAPSSLRRTAVRS